VESLESGRPEMRQTLDRAEKFLSLVALLSALLSAVAVALAARAFANSHLDASAMLRVLGQSQRRIALAYVVEFVSIALAASAAGVLLGWAVHHVFVWLLAGLVESALPAASLWPALFGMGMGLTLLLAFGLPPVLQLAQVPPLRVMRRDLGALKPASWLVLGVGVTGFAALLMVASRDIKLGLIAVGGFAVAVLLFAGLAWLAVKLLRRWSMRHGAALAGHGHAPGLGQARVCRGAGQLAGRGAAGPGAAGAAAHRSDCQLAQGHAGQCARPLCHQCPARSGAGLSGRAEKGRRAQL
jgi:putative ABC transport system permease protein